MKITLEQVEFLKEKAGLNHEEAKELMEEAEGDLLQALKILESRGQIAIISPMVETAETAETVETVETVETDGNTFWYRLWEISKSVKLRVNGTGGTLFQVPLVLGVAGAAAFPRLASWGMLGLLLTRCSLEITRRREGETP